MDLGGFGARQLSFDTERWRQGQTSMPVLQEGARAPRRPDENPYNDAIVRLPADEGGCGIPDAIVSKGYRLVEHQDRIRDIPLLVNRLLNAAS
jgi:hypothetical protein